MRLLLLLLLTLPTLAQSPLEHQLQTVARAHHGTVALYAEDATRHLSVGISPDTPVQTASVIKLAILYDALLQLRTGRVHLDDPIPLTASDRVPGSGVLTLLDAAPPITLTFKDALTLMIALSDNTATNLAIDHLTLAAINASVKDLPNTHLYKKVFTPISPGTNLPEDFKTFGLGKTTPREITTLMQRITTCTLPPPALPGDPALCHAALHMLQLQFTRTGIPRYLDRLPGYTDTSSIANKTGALNAVRNDVAAISTPHGPIYISVFTYNNADHTWGPDHEAELTIAHLARAIVDAWSPEGLAPWARESDLQGPR